MNTSLFVFSSLPALLYNSELDGGKKYLTMNHKYSEILKKHKTATVKMPDLHPDDKGTVMMLLNWPLKISYEKLIRNVSFQK